jgi:hypothetical protein
VPVFAGRVLGRQPQRQLPQYRRSGGRPCLCRLHVQRRFTRSTCQRGKVPGVTSIPSQTRFPMKPGQRRDHHAVGPGPTRAGALPTQHRVLMTQISMALDGLQSATDRQSIHYRTIDVSVVRATGQRISRVVTLRRKVPDPCTASEPVAVLLICSLGGRSGWGRIRLLYLIMIRPSTADCVLRASPLRGRAAPSCRPALASPYPSAP